MKEKHPIQPLEKDQNETLRFKENHYKEAEDILKSVAGKLNLMVKNGEEDISYYYSNALDGPIQSLIEAIKLMAIAENADL